MTGTIPNKEPILNFNLNKQFTESITPHRLCVATLIQEFCKYKGSLEFQASSNALRRTTIKNCCFLFLTLIQSPDMPLDDLIAVIAFVAHNNCLMNEVLRRFKQVILNINKAGVQVLLDSVEEINGLLCNKEKATLCTKDGIINKASVIGFYCRRLVITFDRLLFSEVTTFLDTFLTYSLDLVNDPDIGEHFCTLLESRGNFLLNIHNDQWTRRQAELFIATQTALLQHDEESAMDPQSLHGTLLYVLESNPDLAEAHFLNYLNYMRVKEYCGAIESLYHSFDKSASTENYGPDEKPKSYRYAALNMALLHYQFGQQEEALEALNESIRLAQEANDSVCLEHALTWLHIIDDISKDRMLESCNGGKDAQDTTNMTYLKALGIQSVCLYASVHCGSPRLIFEKLCTIPSMSQPCIPHIRDLTSNQQTIKTALYAYFGRPGLASIAAQLLLFQHTSPYSTVSRHQRPLQHSSVGGAVRERGESYAQALCTVAQHLHEEGRAAQAHGVLSLAREEFRSDGGREWEMLHIVDNLINFEQLLHMDHPHFAESHVDNLTCSHQSIHEAIIRRAELLVARGDYADAEACVEVMLDRADDSSPLFRHARVRAILLLVEIQTAVAAQGGDLPQGIATHLQSALALTRERAHLVHLESIARLFTAHILLLQHSPNQALVALRHPRCLATILSHAGRLDRARALLLHIKCRIAAVAVGRVSRDVRRKKVLSECVLELDAIKEWFGSVGALWRVRDVLYLQIQIFNELNMVEKRNEASLQYRHLVEENPLRDVHSVLTSL